jgi:hypothetical protein
MTPISTNPSRKRSRDESAFQADADGSYFTAQQVVPPEAIPEEPIYGEGMTLLNPRTGLWISAESQTGTWYEEKEAEEAKNQPEPTTEFRPTMPSSRKSIRLSPGSVRPLLDPTISAPASPPKMVNPEVDEATIALGIGWTKIASEDVDIQAAARGWARYIEIHYTRHIRVAEILLKSNGLNAYLVGCQEGFYLFSENLLEGRLVGRTWDVCLQNLKSQPIAFEGDEVLKAERTPGPDSALAGLEKMENWVDSHRLNVVGASGGMDID